MKIILSTRNPSKAEQIKAMFTSPDVVVFTLDEAGIEGDAIEDGVTLEENALKKVRHAQPYINDDVWIMADDTGLFITALGGRPGIHAARWAGDVTTDEITAYTLEQLKGATDRSAEFVTSVALRAPNGTVHYFTGTCKGTLLEAPRTKPQPKMPYSPLFVPTGSDKCWAEMTVDEENAVSHRGQAFRKVVQFLETQSIEA